VTNLPGQSVAFDRVADRYDATRGGTERGEQLRTDILPWLVAGLVLEVGVGTGIIAAALTEAGRDVVGVDLSAGMVSRAYERIGPRVARANAQQLPFGDASVPNVLFVWVLHLVGDMAAALDEAARVLTHGGRVVALHGIPTAERSDLDEALQHVDSVRWRRPDTPEALTAAAERCGLRVIHSGLNGGHPIGRSPTEVADQIETRAWSYLWRLTDEQWQRHALPAIAALRALPDPDVVRTYVQRQQITVLEK
jgi:SAM-dependent methyltransferase